EIYNVIASAAAIASGVPFNLSGPLPSLPGNYPLPQPHPPPSNDLLISGSTTRLLNNDTGPFHSENLPHFSHNHSHLPPNFISNSVGYLPCHLPNLSTSGGIREESKSDLFYPSAYYPSSSSSSSSISSQQITKLSLYNNCSPTGSIFSSSDRRDFHLTNFLEIDHMKSDNSLSYHPTSLPLINNSVYSPSGINFRSLHPPMFDELTCRPNLV
ncbi:unnamed protein product, partial [Heterobilharzia americana]